MNTKGKAIRLSKMQFFKINELCMVQWRGIYFQHQITSGPQMQYEFTRYDILLTFTSQNTVKASNSHQYGSFTKRIKYWERHITFKRIEKNPKIMKSYLSSPNATENYLNYCNIAT